MSAYFDQLLSATGVLPAPGVARDTAAAVSETPAELLEMSQETESGPAAAGPRPGSGTVAMARNDGLTGRATEPGEVSPVEASAPATPSTPPPTVVRGPEKAGAASLSPPQIRAEAITPPPFPEPRQVTFREIVQWVTAGSGDRVRDDPRAAAGVDPVMSLSQPMADLALQAPQDQVPNGIDGPPSRMIGRERIVTIETPGSSTSAVIESAAPVAAARPQRPGPSGRPSVETDEVTVSIGAIHVVVEGPRTVADRVVSEPKPQSVGSRLVRRYLRPL